MSNVGFICGGVVTNVVIDCVMIWVEVWSHDLVFCKCIFKEIQVVFWCVVKEVCNMEGVYGDLDFRLWFDYELFLLNEDELCVFVVEEVVCDVGFEF